MVANIRTGRQPSPTYGCLGTPKPWGRARFPYGSAETAKLLFSGWYITGFVNSAIESRFVFWSLDSFFCIDLFRDDAFFPNRSAEAARRARSRAFASDGSLWGLPD